MSRLNGVRAILVASSVISLYILLEDLNYETLKFGQQRVTPKSLEYLNNIAKNTTSNLPVSIKDFKGNSTIVELLEKAELSLENIASFQDERCPDLRTPCQVSKKCEFLGISLHRSVEGSAPPPRDSVNYDELISQNLEEILNKKTLRSTLRARHLRVRNAYKWLTVDNLFLLPLVAITQVVFAKRLGLVTDDKPPFIYMPEGHKFYKCESANAPHFWEQWFEPISDANWRDIEEDEVWEFSQETIIELFLHKNNSLSSLYLGGAGRKQVESAYSKDASTKTAMQEMVKYFVLDEGFTTTSNLLSRELHDHIGLHMDNRCPEAGLLGYTSSVNRYRKTGTQQLFLVGDEDAATNFKHHMTKELKEKVSYFPMPKMDDDEDVPIESRRAHQALLEAYLLSETRTIITCGAVLGEFAIFLRKYSPTLVPAKYVDVLQTDASPNKRKGPSGHSRKLPSSVSVYMITMPQRREAAEAMMKQLGFFSRTTFVNATTDVPKDQIHHLSILRKSELANAMSHRRVYERFVRETSTSKGENFALIFEDDVAPEYPGLDVMEDIAMILKARSKIPWDVVNLGRCFDCCETDCVVTSYFEDNAFVRSNHSFCAHAYLVNRKGAAKLIQAASPIKVIADDNIVLSGRKGDVKHMSITPRLFVQRRSEMQSLINPTSDSFLECAECQKCSPEVAFMEEVVHNQMRCDQMKIPCEFSESCVYLDVQDEKIERDDDVTNAKLHGDTITEEVREQLKGKHLRIRSPYKFLHACGFFTFPLLVMNQLRAARRLDLIGDKKPFVYMPETHHYFSCKSNTSTELNFWDVWFHPVSEVTIDGWRRLNEEEVWEFSQNSIMTAYYDSDAIKTYPYGGNDDVPSPDWIQTQRDKAQKEMVNIRVREEFVEESLTFYKEHLGAAASSSQVLGMHMRGTDKFVTPKVPPEDYIDEGRGFLKKHPKGKIFLATDDPEYTQLLRATFGSKLVVREVMRDQANVLYIDTVNKNLKVKEVLIDALILSLTSSLLSEELSEHHKMNDDDIADSDRIDHDESQLARDDGFEFILKTHSYLPTQAAALAVSREKVNTLLAGLDYIFHPLCQYSHKFTPKVVEFGFGATVNSLVKPVLHAVKYGYCLAQPQGFRKYFCEEGWEMLFAALGKGGKGGLPSGLPGGSVVNASDDRTGCSKVFSAPTFESSEFQRCSKLYSYPLHGSTAFPSGFKSMGLFVSVSIILKRLLRPSASLQAKLSSIKKEIEWPEDENTKVMAIHFRAGDSCLEPVEALGRICDPFSRYMLEAKRMKELYDVSDIYLATDSDAIYDEISEYESEFNFHFVRNMARGDIRNRMSIDDALEQGKIDGCKEAQNVLIDLYLLGDADFFIGKFSSNMDRIAYNLQFARKLVFPPFVSLDNAWCFDFGVESRSNLYVEKGMPGEKVYC
eukprot:jgi/Bigna1/79635/fgenesh1_pg.64_\